VYRHPFIARALGSKASKGMPSRIELEKGEPAHRKGEKVSSRKKPGPIFWVTNRKLSFGRKDGNEARPIDPRSDRKNRRLGNEEEGLRNDEAVPVDSLSIVYCPRIDQGK